MTEAPLQFLRTPPGKEQNPAPAEQTAETGGGGGWLVCKACRSRITTIAQRTSVAGQHRHVFCNPHGYVYSLGCFSEAFGCMALGPPSQEFSWFAGWAWRIAVCKGCRNHLGWEFESTQDPACFWGLILDQLVDEREGKI